MADVSEPPRDLDADESEAIQREYVEAQEREAKAADRYDSKPWDGIGLQPAEAKRGLVRHRARPAKRNGRRVWPGLPPLFEPGYGWAEERAKARYYLNRRERQTSVYMRAVWINPSPMDEDDIPKVFDSHGDGSEWDRYHTIHGATGNPPGRQRHGVTDAPRILERIDTATDRYTVTQMTGGKRGSHERKELARICGAISSPTVDNPVNMEALGIVLGIPERTLYNWRDAHKEGTEMELVATDGQIGSAVVMLEDMARQIQDLARMIGTRFPTDQAVTEAVNRMLERAA